MSFCNQVQLIWKMTERGTFGENIFPDWCLMAKKIESARWNGREADESNLISKHSICRVGGLVFWLKLRLICMLSPLDRHSSISLPETRTFKCMMWIHHLLLIVFLMIPLRAVATVEVQPSAYIREWQLCRTNSNKWNTRERYWISPPSKAFVFVEHAISYTQIPMWKLMIFPFPFKLALIASLTLETPL